MKRTCLTCEREYNDDEKGATARVDGKFFFIACSRSCLVRQLKAKADE